MNRDLALMYMIAWLILHLVKGKYTFKKRDDGYYQILDGDSEVVRHYTSRLEAIFTIGLLNMNCGLEEARIIIGALFPIAPYTNTRNKALVVVEEYDDDLGIRIYADSPNIDITTLHIRRDGKHQVGTLMTQVVPDLREPYAQELVDAKENHPQGENDDD
jgi:hypothetical protein